MVDLSMIPEHLRSQLTHLQSEVADLQESFADFFLTKDDLAAIDDGYRDLQSGRTRRL